MTPNPGTQEAITVCEMGVNEIDPEILGRTDVLVPIVFGLLTSALILLLTYLYMKSSGRLR